MTKLEYIEKYSEDAYERKLASAAAGKKNIIITKIKTGVKNIENNIMQLYENVKIRGDKKVKRHFVLKIMT